MAVYSHWKGFEFNPQGCLLEQVIDLTRPMGVAYERSCQYYKDFHTHDRLMFVFPRSSCAMEVRTRHPSKRYRVDHSSVLIVPAGLEHDDEGKSSIYDTLALYPDENRWEEALKSHGLSRKALNQLQQECTKLKRSFWLDQLIQKYFFARIVSKEPNIRQLEFFESEILSEILSVALGKTRGTQGNLAQLEQGETVATRAIKFIESNLFSKLDLKLIARQSGTSVPTLLRHFKAETSQTPYAYIKSRRLEEARILLRKGLYSVGEIAVLVGYENFGAFSDAFTQKYKRAPSSFLRK